MEGREGGVWRGGGKVIDYSRKSALMWVSLKVPLFGLRFWVGLRHTFTKRVITVHNKTRKPTNIATSVASLFRCH